MDKKRLLDKEARFQYGTDSEESIELTRRLSMTASAGGDLPPKAATFLDGTRRVDFVLVYGSDEDGFVNVRENFHKRLKKTGLELEEISPELQDSDVAGTYWILIHAPFRLLLQRAEKLMWKMPISKETDYASAGARLVPNVPCMKTRLESRESSFNHYRAIFRKDKRKKFLNYNRPNEFFTSAERSRLVYDVLQTSQYSNKESDVGVDRLVQMGAYQAAFPLHEGPATETVDDDDDDDDLSQESARQKLKKYWSSWKVFYKFQPYNHIRNYFGEKIAFYFLFLGLLSTWLIPIALLGTAITLYGYFTRFSSVVTQTCTSTLNECPTCDRCDPFPINKSCATAKLSRTFDNELTIAFAAVMSFWTALFFTFWKRRALYFAYYWNTQGRERFADRPRANYASKATSVIVNPATGKEEPFFPLSSRNCRIAVTWSVTSLMITALIILVIAIALYRTVIFVALIDSKASETAVTVGLLSADILNLINIIVLSAVYQRLAKLLTNWEMHRTDEEHEYHLTLKTYVFEFVNNFAPFFYIAFFKTRLEPGQRVEVFGYELLDQCPVVGCFSQLAQQLLIILIGKQVYAYIANPRRLLLALYLKLKSQKKKPSLVWKHQWERDYFDCLEYPGLFIEYRDTVILFGFVTIFVAAMPLAPLLFLLHNVIQLRANANKLVSSYRRPIAYKADGIGLWQTVVSVIIHLAIVTNGFLIAFTSDIVPQLFYSINRPASVNGTGMDGYLDYSLQEYNCTSSTEPFCHCWYKDYADDGYFYHLLSVRLIVVLAFDLLVLVVSYIIDVAIPEIPLSLRLRIKRELYLETALFDDN
ncbi:anoctamin-7-like [Oscarella lobularis]|uniref:anoctamin-7-like n=1 Tax=Oscarella lobularis TaxID=121494 RepID=UPI0033131C94